LEIHNQKEKSHTIRVVVSTCRHGRRRTGTTLKGSGEGLLLDRRRYIELPLSQDDAFSLKQTEARAMNKGTVRYLTKVDCLSIGRDIIIINYEPLVEAAWLPPPFRR